MKSSGKYLTDEGMNAPPGRSILIRISPLLFQNKKPAEWRAFCFGGDGEIRTLEELLTPTRFPIVRARPTTRHLRVLLKTSDLIVSLLII